MRRVSQAQLRVPARRRSREVRHLGVSTCGAIALSVLALSATPVAAQNSTSTEVKDANASCQVFAVDTAEGQPRELRASCLGSGLMLGPVSDFQVFANKKLAATLVDARLGAERRLLLLGVQDDGQPIVEELTGDIALTAGGGRRAAISDVELDFTGFAQTGEIGVPASAEGQSAGRTGKFSVGQSLAAARARHGKAAKN